MSEICRRFSKENILLQNVQDGQGKVLKSNLYNAVIAISSLLTSPEKLKQWGKLTENIFKMATICIKQRTETKLKIGFSCLPYVFIDDPDFVSYGIFRSIPVRWGLYKKFCLLNNHRVQNRMSSDQD